MQAACVADDDDDDDDYYYYNSAKFGTVRPLIAACFASYKPYVTTATTSVVADKANRASSKCEMKCLL